MDDYLQCAIHKLDTRQNVDVVFITDACQREGNVKTNDPLEHHQHLIYSCFYNRTPMSFTVKINEPTDTKSKPYQINITFYAYFSN